MTQEKYNLQWREFESSASQTVRDLFANKDFTDVTLISHDEEQIEAHKVILCAASPFFKRILLKNPHQNPLLYLKDVSMKTLRSLISFIYLGQVEIEQDLLETFLTAAKDLEVKGLSNDMTNSEPEQPICDDLKGEEDIDQQNATQIMAENVFDMEPLEENVSTSLLFDNIGTNICGKCGYKARNQSTLKTHTDAIHEGVRYPCDHCEYKATQKSALNRHIKKHTF